MDQTVIGTKKLTILDSVITNLQLSCFPVFEYKSHLKANAETRPYLWALGVET